MCGRREQYRISITGESGHWARDCYQRGADSDAGGNGGICGDGDTEIQLEPRKKMVILNGGICGDGDTQWWHMWRWWQRGADSHLKDEEVLKEARKKFMMASQVLEFTRVVLLGAEKQVDEAEKRLKACKAKVQVNAAEKKRKESQSVLNEML
ncbi:hypothetical protein C5167_028838 [Papaver somniferum]|nr:hypothetical protein C5167_028838 [Papaver somniferum]